ncbi:MAG: TolC family outer membrane protein [Magnetococcus sp. DMHC-6]
MTAKQNKAARTIFLQVILILSWMLVGEGLAWAGMDQNSGSDRPWIQVVEYAMQHNPQIQAAIATLEMSRQRYGNQSLADLLPQVNSSVSYTSTKFESKMAGEREVTFVDPIVLSVGLSQPIFNLKSWLAYRQGNPLIAVYLQELEAIRQTVLLQVLERIIGVVQAEEIAKIANSYHEAATQHFQDTQKRFKVREVTRTDVNQAWANVGTTLANRTKTEQDIDIAKLNYTEIVGTATPDLLVVPWISLEDLWQRSWEEVEKDLAVRPDIRARQEQKRAAEMGIEVVYAGHLPTLQFSSTVNHHIHHAMVGFGDPLNEYKVGMVLSMPIYSGGKVTSQRDQALADLDVKQAELDRIQLQAIREVKEAALNYQTAKNNDSLYVAVAESSRLALQGTQQEFHVGTRTALDILESQSKFFAAQIDLIKNRYAMLLAQFQLLNSLGRMTIEDVLAHKASPPTKN